MDIKKILQKIAGIALVALTIWGIKLTTDGTAAFVTIPFGLWLIFSKQQIIEF